jgi:hypothetical protein
MVITVVLIITGIIVGFIGANSATGKTLKEEKRLKYKKSK